MLDMMNLFSGAKALLPPEACSVWEPELVGLHLFSDGFTALADYSIPLTLFYLVRKRGDLPFQWLFLLISALCVGNGSTHLMAIWTLWHPTDWLAGIITLLTATVSVVAAGLLVSIVPQALALPRLKELELANGALRESEKRFQAFMNYSPLAAWITNADGLMLHANSRYLHTLHHFEEAVTEEAITGETVSELYPVAIATPFLEANRQVIATNQVVEGIDVVPRPDGTVDRFLVYKFPITGLRGQTLVGGVAIDISEQERTKEQLQSLNDRLQYLLIHAPVMIFSCKPEGDYGATWVSENIRTLLGYEPQDFLDDSGFWANHIHPDDRDRVLTHTAQIFGTGHHAHEYRFLHADGTYRWVYNQLQLMQDDMGNPTEIIGYLLDISDRKRTEQALQEREAFLRAIGDNIPNGYLYQLVREPDGHYRYTYVSAGIEQVSGLKPEAVLADPSLMFQLVVEEDLPHMLQEAEESAQNLSIFDIQVRERLSNGENRWLRLCSMPRRLENGQVVWDGIRLDINDLKQTEETLRQSEERWHLAVSGSNDGIWDHNLETNEHYLSPRCLEILGYGYADIDTFDKWLQQVHPEDAARLQATFQTYVEHRLPNYACEYRVRCKDGSDKWLLARGKVVWDEQGTPLRAVGSLTDISERKLTEEALRQSEAKNRAILAAFPDLLLRIRRDGTCLDYLPPTPPKAGTFLPIRQHIAEILPNDLLQHELQRIEQALATGELQVWEHQFMKEGKACDEEIRLIPYGEDEALLIVRDISDRKRSEAERQQIEAALRQSEARNRALIQAIPDLLIRMKQDGTYLAIQETGNVRMVNPHLTAVGNSIYSTLPVDLAQKRMAYAQQALQTRKLQVYEYSLRIDDRLQFEEARIVPCGDDEVLVMVRDITDRMQAEETLRRYERIVSATTDAIALIDRNYVYQVVNQSYLNWYNKSQDEIVGHPVSELLPLKVYETTIKPRLDQCLTGQVVQYELWADYTPSGPCLLSVTYDPYYDTNQAIAGVVVSLRNITRLKQAEVELELQSVIVKNMAEGVCMVQVRDGIFVYANPKFERMFGYDAHELIGQHLSIVIYEDRDTDTTETYENLANIILEQGEASYEVHNVKKDGTPFWGQATTSIFEHPTYGTVFVVVQQDITERKQAEASIRSSLREKEVLLKEIHHRVKNNLGVVDSLLQMQSRRSSDPQLVVALKESQNRMASIALVHEKLYGANDFANIDFSQYITDLTAHLFDCYNIHANQVGLVLQIEPISLDLDTAIPCGLIINELVSNALKYAFPNGQAGKIQVNFQQCHDHTITLSVKDTGIGLPQNFNLKQRKTLGITLVQGLVKQLRGTLTISVQQGTIFAISFNRP